MTPRKLAALTVLYAVVQLAAQLIADVFETTDGVSIWFPPAAFMLAYLLAVGWRGFLPAVVVRLAVGSLTGATLGLTHQVVASAIIVVTYAVAADNIRRHRRTVPSSTPTPGTVLRFILVGAIAAPTVAGLTSRLALFAMLGQPITDALDPALRFAVGDGLAVATLVPAIQLLRFRMWPSTQPSTMVSMAATLATSLGLVWATTIGPARDGDLTFLLVLPVITLAILGGSVWFGYGQAALIVAVTWLLGSDAQATEADVTSMHALWWSLSVSGNLASATANAWRSALAHERAARAEQIRLRQTFETLFGLAATPTLTYRPADGAVVQVNQAMADLMGTTPEALLGSHAPSLWEAGADTRALTPQVDVDAGPTVLEQGFMTADGRERSGRILLAAAPGADGAPAVVIAQFVDLTAEHARQAALQRSRHALDEYTRRVAHDLKMPLAAIRGFAETLVGQRGRLPPAVETEVLGRIASAAQRLAEQLDGMRSSAARLEPQPVGADIAMIAGWVENVLSLELHRVDGSLTVQAPPTDIQIDENVTRQVLLNLVSNSLRYRRPDVPPVIELTVEPRDGGLECVVTDNGRGIPRNQLRSVFVEGTRLAPEVPGGEGTGLASSRRLAVQAGGSLEAVHHEPGARFVLWMPALSGDAVGDPSAQLTDHRRRVLLVDDDPDLRLVVRTMFNNGDDFSVVGETDTLADAPDLAARKQPDVILLDRLLPDGDGIDAIPALRTAAPNAAVVLLTSQPLETVEPVATAAGALACLDKQLSPPLEGRLRTALDGNGHRAVPGRG